MLRHMSVIVCPAIFHKIAVLFTHAHTTWDTREKCMHVSKASISGSRKKLAVIEIAKTLIILRTKAFLHASSLVQQYVFLTRFVLHEERENVSFAQIRRRHCAL